MGTSGRSTTSPLPPGLADLTAFQSAFENRDNQSRAARPCMNANVRGGRGGSSPLRRHILLLGGTRPAGFFPSRRSPGVQLIAINTLGGPRACACAAELAREECKLPRLSRVNSADSAAHRREPFRVFLRAETLSPPSFFPAFLRRSPDISLLFPRRPLSFAPPAKARRAD